VKAEPVKPVTAFEQKKAAAAPAPPKPKVYQVTIKITGVAYSDVQVSDFIQALGRHEFFQDVNLIVSEQFTYNNDEVRRFQLEMTLNPDAVVKHETPTNKQVKELD
jgi:Tfp pilus assembly protein PilN